MNRNSTSLLKGAYARQYDDFAAAADALEMELRSWFKDVDFMQSKSASLFVLTCMREHYAFQERFGGLFGRRTSPSSDAQFTAVISIALGRYLSVSRAPLVSLSAK